MTSRLQSAPRTEHQHWKRWWWSRVVLHHYNKHSAKEITAFEMASLDLSGKGSLFSLVVPFLDLKGDETRGKSIFKDMKRDVFLLGGESQMSKFGLNSWCCFDSQGAQTQRNVRNYKVVWPRLKQTEPTQGRVPNMCSLPVTTWVFRTKQKLRCEKFNLPRKWGRGICRPFCTSHMGPCPLP